MTDRLMNKVNYILDAYWQRESSQIILPSGIYSSGENHISYIALQTD